MTANAGMSMPSCSQGSLPESQNAVAKPVKRKITCEDVCDFMGNFGKVALFVLGGGSAIGGGLFYFLAINSVIVATGGAIALGTVALIFVGVLLVLLGLKSVGFFDCCSED